MKLFTLGDSISQGFMSGAAARTDLCFSTLLARAMGLSPGPERKQGTNYYYPHWPKNGLPANLEAVFRALHRDFGAEINGLEWLTVLHAINKVLDDSEDYYEREEGRADNPYPGQVPYFHNVSSWSLNVADAWLLTPEVCRKEILRLKPISGGDGWMAVANAAFYRTALKVLDPNLDCNFSQLDWLERHTETEGIENLVLWLGTNNALESTLTLHIHQTPNSSGQRPHQLPHMERRNRGWNLWHPGDFKHEYRELVQRVDNIMETNVVEDWKVFVGTIPSISFVPLLKGLGPGIRVPGKGTYYKYYTYVPFHEEYALKRGMYYTLADVLHVDDCIREYNRIIREEISEANRRCMQRIERAPYFIVDIGHLMDCITWKNRARGSDVRLPAYFNFVYPPVGSDYYDVDADGRLRGGGYFSLDGLHPSAIAQGLIAREFMRVMEENGVKFASVLDWEEIFASDTLYSQPLPMIREIHRSERLAEQVVKIVQGYLFSEKKKQ